MPAPYTAEPLNDIHSTSDTSGHIQHHDDLAYWLSTKAAAASDGRLLAMSFNPKYTAGSGNPAAGVAAVARIPTPKPLLVTNIEVVVTTAPTGTAQANVFLALYDVNTLARLAITADMSSTLGTAGPHACALTAQLTVPGGPGTAVYAALLVGTAAGTTPMALAKSTGTGNSDTVNFDYTAPQFAAATFGSALTALPNPATTLTKSGNLYLFGLS